VTGDSTSFKIKIQNSAIFTTALEEKTCFQFQKQNRRENGTSNN